MLVPSKIYSCPSAWGVGYEQGSWVEGHRVSGWARCSLKESPKTERLNSTLSKDS